MNTTQERICTIRESKVPTGSVVMGIPAIYWARKSRADSPRGPRHSGCWAASAIAAFLVFCLIAPRVTRAAVKFTTSFCVKKSELSSVGTNPFFILRPGYQLVLKGIEDGKPTVLTISVLPETKVVDGVKTRVVEEREVAEGKIVEISRNYYAISGRTNDIFYFGEESDAYKDGKMVSREGSWLSGENGAKFGLMMPGTPLLGARYQQENAPKVALDRAEIVGLNEAFSTPAGKFGDCLKTEESSGLEGGKEYKLYVPGIGLIQDGGLRLVRHGYKLTK
jgi:hypothetical protein